MAILWMQNIKIIRECSFSEFFRAFGPFMTEIAVETVTSFSERKGSVRLGRGGRGGRFGYSMEGISIRG